MLKDNTIYLRAVEPDDLDFLYKSENDSSLWIHGNTLSPYSKNTIKQYIEEAQQYDVFESNQLRLIICSSKDDKRLGAIDLYDIECHHSRTGMGLFVIEECRNKGYATNAIELIKEYCFDFLNLHQIYVHVATSNVTSIHLFKSMNFTEVGILKDWIFTIGKYEDVLVLQILSDKNEG